LEPPVTIPQMFATKQLQPLKLNIQNPMELCMLYDPANLAGAGCAY
jgi:hypothetical protein